MAFGFRKSKSFRPFRITASKSGVSMSARTAGTRITKGVAGTYITVSKGGFYYRAPIQDLLARLTRFVARVLRIGEAGGRPSV